MKKVKPVTSKRGPGAWPIAILLTVLVAIGLFVCAKGGRGWGLGISFLGSAFSGDSADGDNGDQASNPTLSLPDVVVGLRGGGTDLYVDAAFDLEVASEQDRDAVRGQLSRVRDETIGFLSELSPDELRGSGELAKVKTRLLERFRNVMPNQRLKALYLTYLAVAQMD
jgi:flagellar basal body-associated protein FliL